MTFSVFCVSTALAAQGDTTLKNPVTIQGTDNPFLQSRGDITADNVKNTILKACLIGDAFTLKNLTRFRKGGTNVVDENGNTALHYAAMFIAKEGAANKKFVVAPAEVIGYLLNDCKLDVNAVNKYGYTAMHIAAVVDEAGLLEYMIQLNRPTPKKKYSEGKINYKVQAKNGMTILHAAALNSIPPGVLICSEGLPRVAESQRCPRQHPAPLSGYVRTAGPHQQR